MSIEVIISSISFGVALVNCAVTAGVYLKYAGMAQQIVCMVTADEDGKVRISDLFSWREDEESSDSPS